MSVPELNAPTKSLLIRIARHAIERELHVREGARDPGPPPETDGSLCTPCGTFVTLKTGQPPALRGCIGTIEAEGPLDRAVARYARLAAFEDPRFPPLCATEWPRVSLSISVLAPSRTIESPQRIEPGRHGVILEREGRRALFLPQVALEQGWDRTTLLENLARKAGLSPGAWRGSVLSVFEAESFGEPAEAV